VRILLAKGQIHSQWEDMWADALRKNGYDVTVIAILKNRNNFLRILNNISSWFWNMPFKINKTINYLYKYLLCKSLRSELKVNNYDIFFTYNGYNEIDNYTMNFIKKRVQKVICIYGDNPLFDSKMKFDLFKWFDFVDIGLVFDKYQKQCFDMYNKKTVLLPAGTDVNRFFPIKPSSKQISEFGSDLLYVGNSLAGNQIWGDHRARILNSLSEFNLKIYGDERWRKHFVKYPNLQKNVVFRKLSTEELNVAINCTKIYLAITNPTVVNGVITRVFDAVSAGTLVIYEYRDYLFELFGDAVPTFRNLDELKDIVNYYLINAPERKEKIQKARQILIDKYLVIHNVKHIKPLLAL